MSTAEGPGGWVVILFGTSECEETDLNKCVMSAHWFAKHEQAKAYMATMPEWTAPHCLPLWTERSA